MPLKIKIEDKYDAKSLSFKELIDFLELDYKNINLEKEAYETFLKNFEKEFPQIFEMISKTSESSDIFIEKVRKIAEKITGKELERINNILKFLNLSGVVEKVVEIVHAGEEGQ